MLIRVIDDDLSVRTALKRLLISAGFEVATFASAKGFMDCGDCDAPGCLILDVRMPGMSGMELQAQLASAGCSLPIIFITAHEDLDARQKAMAAGAVAFLLKPFEDQVLLDAIGDAVGRYR